MLCGLLAAQFIIAADRLGAVGFRWLVGVTVAFLGLSLVVTLRSWTTVGTDGITICWGIGRGRTYPWQDIRQIDVRETKNQLGTDLAARITLAGGRRRSLPGLHHSNLHPSPDFDVNFQRVVNWWELSRDQTAQVKPPKRLRDRLTPTVTGILLGLLIMVVVIVVDTIKS
ncbi:hypothetical protein CTZ27_20820 [Streptomyces griseocarneus]|nr:hypothetical protein CTZ27_20820 [Streptomyces griseocarneus]